MKRTLKLLVGFLIKPVITPLWLAASALVFFSLANHGHFLIGLSIFIVTTGLFVLLAAFERNYQRELAEGKAISEQQVTIQLVRK